VSTALYRRYRPETFADVIGQEHVTEPLMQALRTGRVNHAYLFSGPRGCGKTTSARILARCLNCEQGPTPTPCGQCDSCVALARGGPGSVDVIEIDAASHGGVDDARDLRERASYGPAQSRFKVYIIDEAHMVTPQGFNALLKIVEEPPEHVKFVFATTEPEKVIGTIRSRTHHYPFRLVPPGQLTDYMERLCRQEGVTVAPGVLSFVTRAGGGSVRDSLSVLDQLIAGSGEEGLTYEGAAALLGFTDAELLDAIIDAFAAGDAAGVFHQVDRVVETGLDPRRFVEDLLERLRDLIVVAAVPDGASSVLRLLPQDQVERMRHQAAAFGGGALSRAADIVNAGLTEMTGAIAPRLQLELICARVLLPGASGESGYAARLDRLERRLDVEGVPSVTRGASAPAQPAGPTAPAPASAAPTPAAPSPAAPPTAVAAAPAAAAPDHDHSAERPDPVEQRSDAREHIREQPDRTAPDTPAVVAATPAVADESHPPAAPAAKGPGGLDTAAIRRAWPDVLAKIFALKRSTWTFLSEHAQVLELDGQRLLLGISTVGLANTFRRGQHAELVRQALIDVLGVDVRVEGIPTPDPSLSAPSGQAHPSVTPDNGPGGRPSPAPAEPAASLGEAEPADGGRGGTPGVVGGSPAPEAGDGGWASAPAAPGSGPSWASDTPGAAGSQTAGATRSRLAQAREAVAAEQPEPTPEQRVADDSVASADDEDVEALGEVGRPVIERILGGTVIDEGP
jgi:DNA polymerase-3 subunit gamma/tau